MLSGSAQLLIGRGLTESLAGRFEIAYVPHWGYSEMKRVFGWSLEQYIHYGAYSAAAPLVAQPTRWKRYIRDSLIETTIAGRTLDQARKDRTFWGRLVESAVGAHLVNAASEGWCKVFYWRNRNREVGFVVRAGRTVTAIEVKSGRTRRTLPGIAALAAAFKPNRVTIGRWRRDTVGRIPVPPRGALGCVKRTPYRDLRASLPPRRVCRNSCASPA